MHTADPPRRSPSTGREECGERPIESRSVHPLLRDVVIAAVGLLVSGGLAALALLNRDPGLSVLGMLASAILAALVGLFLFVQGWIWSRRAARQGYAGRSLAIAIGGGLMVLFAAAAAAGATILVVLFYLT